MADVEAPLDWSGAASAPVQPANVVLVQGSEDEVFLTFGYAAPSIAMITRSDSDDAEPVEVQAVTRVSLPLRVARVLAARLHVGVTVQEASAPKQETTQ